MSLPDKKIIGERLRKLRGSRTQAEVAKALGLSKMAISNYESGERMPADSVKIEIAKYYNRSVESLFFKQ